DRYRKTLPDNLRILRNPHPNVPILVVSRIPFAKDLTHADFLARREQFRDMQMATVADFRKHGDSLVHLFDGAKLLGPDFDECTVDGVHPNDLGFMRMARKLEPVVRKLIVLRISNDH
ncbi:SGNH/GDSL hydrolase family protein, partial [Thiocapsa sp. C4-3m]|uniref:SGNH/GDSL hydrolase family protein n=1 Tax=Thiocapsa sp. C4-3m TaxID=3137393 RepID=UPI0035B40A68